MAMRVSPKDLRETHNLGKGTSEQILTPDLAGLWDQGLFLAGTTNAGRDYAITRLGYLHSHVMACFGGMGEVLVDGEWRECGVGQAYLMPRRTLHAFRTMPGKSWQWCWVFFLDAGEPTPVVQTRGAELIDADPEPLRQAIAGMYAERVARADAGAMFHWAWLVRHYAEVLVRPEGARDPLEDVWSLVAAHPEEEWSVERIAEIAAVSPEQARRVCHAFLGCSPMRHVTQVRMRHAAALLVATTEKIEQIARRAGYSNAFAFATAFKRHIGQSPSEYRRARRG